MKPTPDDLDAIRTAFERAIEMYAKTGLTTTAVGTSAKKTYRVRIETRGAK